MKTLRATQARMNAVDLRLADRLRARGWIVERAAGPGHAPREYNDFGGICHAPGCDLPWEDHLPCDSGCHHG